MKKSVLWLACWTLGLGCAAQKQTNFMPATAELGLARPQVLDISGYSADARITYFAKGGRIRTSAVLLVDAAGRIRINIFGPHGGVLFAVASDGQRAIRLDLVNRWAFEAAATPAALDAVLGIAPLSLNTKMWSRLLMGEVEIPDNAIYRNSDTQLEASFERRGSKVWVRYPLGGGFIENIVLDNGTARFELSVVKRLASGLPEEILIEGSDKSRALIKFRDTEVSPEFNDAVFQPTIPINFERRMILAE